jgi:hypothetical protein
VTEKSPNKEKGSSSKETPKKEVVTKDTSSKKIKDKTSSK